MILLLGLILLVSGLAIFIGAFFVFGSFAKSAMESRVVQTIPLTVNQSATGKPIEVNREKLCQIVLKADLTGSDVKRTMHGENVNYHLDDKIPFESEVFDDAGNRIHHESSTLSGGGFRMTLNSDVDKGGGSETPRIMLGTFPAPVSEKVSVTAKIGKNQRVTS